METAVDGAGAEVMVTGMAIGEHMAADGADGAVTTTIKAREIGGTWNDLNCLLVKIGVARTGRLGRRGPDAKSVPTPQSSSRQLTRCWPKSRTGSPSQLSCRLTRAWRMTS